MSWHTTHYDMHSNDCAICILYEKVESTKKNREKQIL